MLPLKDVIPPTRVPLLSRALLTLGAIALPILWWQERLDGITAFYFVLNLLYLCVFADTVEDRLGRARFACIVVGSQAAGLAALTILAPGSAVFPWLSGVAGVIGAYVALYPNSRVLVFVPVPMEAHELPALFFVALYFILHIAGTWTRLGPAVAGFAVGAVLCLGLKRPLEWRYR